MFFICDIYIKMYIKDRLAEERAASRVIINDAYSQILIKSDQNTTAPLKHQLCNAFRTAIQNHVTSMADVQNPDDRHYLQTAFSIVFSFATYTEQEHIPEDEHERPVQVCMDQEYALLNKQRISHTSHPCS